MMRHSSPSRSAEVQDLRASTPSTLSAPQKEVGTGTVSRVRRFSERLKRRKELLSLFGACAGLLVSLEILITSSQGIRMGSTIKNLGYALLGFILKHVLKFDQL